MSKSVKGVALVFASALFFSFGGVFIKLSPWSAMALSGGRSLFATLLIVFLMLLRKRGPIVNKWTMLGGLGVFATSTLFIQANKLTTAANAAVLHFTMPVFVIIFSAIFLHRKPKKLDAVTCAFVLAGIVCLFLDGISAGGGLGNVLALISGVTYSVVFFMGEMPDSDPLSSAFFGQLICALAGLPFVFRETEFSFLSILCVVLLGVLEEGMGYVCLSLGIRDTPPVAASLISGAEPVLTPVWVALFYPEEKISPMAFVGIVIVLGAIITYNAFKAGAGNDA